MTDPTDYNKRMTELLTKLGIPTDEQRGALWAATGAQFPLGSRP